LRMGTPWRIFKHAVSRLDWAAILRAHPQLSEQEPANSTSGDQDEESGHEAVVQKADYDIDHERHQERQYRTQQNGSRDQPTKAPVGRPLKSHAEHVA